MIDQKTKELLSACPSKEHWDKIGISHHRGIDVPLSALHTQNSCGIGEFFDLLPLVDWCKDVGFDVIQLLPVNDSGTDPSPYNSLSANALNPIYLSLNELPCNDCLEDMLKPKNRPKLKKRVDYLEVKKYKECLFAEYYSREGKTVIETPQFENFVAQNPWLPPYALFKVLKAANELKDFKKWPKTHRCPNEEEFEELLEVHHHRVQREILVQYFCFQQLQHVKKYAESRGIFLKGDIPILLSPDSADVWNNRELFQPGISAGAPPDAYNTNGQKWGFPVYDWEEMEKQNYRWWRQRLKVASNFFHIYRLDHIIGFFRIWAIPPKSSAKAGFFLPKEKEKWVPLGSKTLEMMLESCPMLPIGEDLGVDPQQVRPTMHKLGICGTKVMRWERFWETDQSYIPVSEYNPDSMTTVSTHDSETLQQWWHDLPQESKPFAEHKGWKWTPELSLEQRKDILTDSNQSGSLFHINLLQEYLAMVPELVWPQPASERINVPGTIAKSNWTYRYRRSLEEIASNQELKNHIADTLR